MDSGAHTYQAPSHEDTSTEYDEHMTRLGVYRAREKPPKPGKMEVASTDADVREDATDDDDDDDDDEFMREYRAQRMAEMQSTAVTFGSVVDITRDSFVEEVTTPSAERVVVVFMTRHGCSDCETMDAALRALAPKYPRTKFCRIPHRECVPNYPDRLTPTLLVYRDKDVAKSFATLAPFGGPHMTPEGVEFALREVDARACPSLEDETEQEIETRRAAYIAGVIARIADSKAMNDAADDDDD